jgi:hypothetical protein
VKLEKASNRQLDTSFHTEDWPDGEAQVQWAMANYLLVKNSASGMWVCGPGQYGQLLIRPEYAAATGAPRPTTTT